MKAKPGMKTELLSADGLIEQPNHLDAMSTPEVRSSECVRECEHQGLFEQFTLGDELIEALNYADLRVAAKLLREAQCLPQPYLAALADMLDGNPKSDPYLVEKFPYRLRLAPWGIRGRKPKGSRAKSFTPHVNKSLPHPSDAMLCSQVKRKMEADPGSTRAAAVADVAKANGVSPSLVGKAYDSFRGRLRRSSSMKAHG